MGIALSSVPIGSLITLPEGQRSHYISLVVELPDAVRSVIFSTETGAYLRGLAKNYQLAPERSSIIALAFVRVAVGELSIAKLASELSTKLPLPNDKANRIAREMEQDLFIPVQQELGEHWAKQRKEGPARQAETKANEGGAKNVLNLKREKSGPPPPPMPRYGNSPGE